MSKMTTEQREWWLRCPEHNTECPNVEGRAGYMQAMFGPPDGRQFVRHDTPTSDLHDLASEAHCPLLRLFATIALLRRLREPVCESNRFLRVNRTWCHRKLLPVAELYVPKFFSMMQNHLWLLLGTGSRRLLMSALETYADHGTLEQQSAATAGVIWLRMMALTHWFSDEPRFTNPAEAKKIGEWALGDHSLYNTPNRLRWQLFRAPEVWLLVHTLMTRSESDLLRGPLRATATSLQVFETPFAQEEKAIKKAVALWRRVYRMLAPSTINPRYAGLYAQHRERQEKNDWRMEITPHDAAFLTARNVKTVLDFGTIKTVAKAPELEVISYDPVAIHATIPQRPFDALVSYGVLERVPEDELPIMATWWRLFVPGVMALRISTRASSSVLANGENAHRTVKPPEWWSAKLRDLFPNHEIDDLIPTRDAELSVQMVKTS